MISIEKINDFWLDACEDYYALQILDTVLQSKITKTIAIGTAAFMNLQACTSAKTWCRSACLLTISAVATSALISYGYLYAAATTLFIFSKIINRFSKSKDHIYSQIMSKCLSGFDLANDYEAFVNNLNLRLCLNDKIDLSTEEKETDIYKQITRLTIADFPIGNIKHLIKYIDENLPNVKTLYITGKEIGDAPSCLELEPINGMQNLTILGLNNCGITDDTLPNLNETKIASISLASNPDITNSCLEYMSNLSLVHLDLGFTDITEEGLSSIKADSLQRLVLNGCKNIIHFEISRFRNLTHLTAQNNIVSDAHSKEIFSLPKLKVLDIRWNNGVTVDFFHGMYNYSMQPKKIALKELILDRTSVTQENIDKLKKDFPRIKIPDFTEFES